jgi:hypothetical protein
MVIKIVLVIFANNELNVFQMFLQQLFTFPHPFELVMQSWMFPPLQNELLIFINYNITMTLLRQASPNIFTCVVNMCTSDYCFLNRVMIGPYCLCDVVLVCLNIVDTIVDNKTFL